MVEASAQKKSEHLPLLMVAGGGDAGLPPRAPPPPITQAVWNTASVVPERRSWGNSFSDYLFSTCWMTCILLAISFLAFYGVGMVVFHRPEYGISFLTCNKTLSTKQVFYHLVIPREEKDFLQGNSRYLSDMALKYPRLIFRVYILINDSDVDERMGNPIYENFNLKEYYFLRRHPNVDISIMPLSKFMCATPLKKKWREVPIEFIPFYARVYSVWLHGGVAIDLAVLGTRDQEYSLRSASRVNKKIDVILTQHSHGISPEKYEEALVQLAKDDKVDFPNVFFPDLILKIINDTMSFFHQSFQMNAAGSIENIQQPVSSQLSVPPQQAVPPQQSVPPKYLVPGEPQSVSPEQSVPSQQSVPPQQSVPLLQSVSPQQSIPPQQSVPSQQSVPPQQSVSLPQSVSQQQSVPPEQSAPSLQSQLVTPQYSEPSRQQPLVRIDVETRELVKEIKIPTSNQPGVVDIILSNLTVLNVTKDKDALNVYDISPNNKTSKKIESSITNINNPFMRGLGNKIAKLFNIPDSFKTNNSMETEIIVFYDMSINADSIDPMFSPPLSKVPRNVETQNKNQPPIYVALDAEGIFIASTSNTHNFLGHILSFGCKRLPPRYVIKNALMSYCAGQNRNRHECNSIFVL